MSTRMLELKNVREAAKQETRDALVAAALAEFGERGLDAPSLDAICARAGFTRGAFYVHFRDRDDLVVAVMDRVLSAFLDAVIGTAEERAPDLETAVLRFAQVLDVLGSGIVSTSAETPTPFWLPDAVPLHRLMEACVRSPAIRDRFVALLRGAIGRLERSARAGQSGGRVRPDVDAGSLGTVLVSLAIGVLAALEAGLPIDLDAMRRTVVALLAPQRA